MITESDCNTKMNSSCVDLMGASMDAITTKRYLQKYVATTLEDEEEWHKDNPREGEEVGCLSEWTTQWKGHLQARRLAHDHFKESLHEILEVLVLPLCEKRTSSNCKCILEVTGTNYDACRIERECDPSTDHQTKEASN